MTLTKEQKEQLVLELRKLKLLHEHHLREAAARVAQNCRRKIHRRVNRVGMTMRSAQIRAVLDLERERTPTSKDVVDIAQGGTDDVEQKR